MYDGSISKEGCMRCVAQFENWFVGLSLVDSIGRRGDGEERRGRVWILEEAIEKLSIQRLLCSQMISGSVNCSGSTEKEIKSGGHHF